MHLNKREKQLAIKAHGLYLANLLVLPVIAFIWLTVIALKEQSLSDEITEHLQSAWRLSIVSGVMLLVLPVVSYFLFGWQMLSATWLILYFVTFHAAFVLLGMLNLTRAMSNKPVLF